MINTPAQAAKNKEPFSVLLLAGLSGAGKTTVINVFEDMRFFSIDGMPLKLIPGLLTVLNAESLAHYRGIIIGMESGRYYSESEYRKLLDDLRALSGHVRLLFVDAKTDAVIRRYATTRRPHPLESEGLGLEKAVETERERLAPLCNMADVVFDTTNFSIHDLRRHVQQRYAAQSEQSPYFKVHLISFGFKYGQPADADMMYDLRFLPNPYFVDELRAHSGLEESIARYVLGQDPGKSFLARLSDFLKYLLPLFEAEGRYRLTIAFGCTGGRHRSVAVTEAVGRILKTLGFAVSIEHRHLELG